MRISICIGLMLGLSMLVCGDFIGSSDYRGNYYSNGFPSVAGNSNPGSNPNYNNHRYPSRDFGGNPDYRGNLDNRPSIYTHGFPSVGGNSNLRGNPNYGSNSNSNGYPNQDPYGNTQYSRDPYSDITNSRGGFGGSSFNYPSPGPTNPNEFSQRGSFGSPQSRPVIAGFPSFSSINLALSRFGSSNSNRPNYVENQYSGGSYPNRSPNNSETESILDVVKLEGNLKYNQRRKKCLEKRKFQFFSIR